MTGDAGPWTAVAHLSEFGADRRLVRVVAGRELLLVRLHRLCLVKATRAGVDPDRPRHLSRSIILS